MMTSFLPNAAVLLFGLLSGLILLRALVDVLAHTFVEKTDD